MDDSTLRRKLDSVAPDWNIQPGTQLQLDASHTNLSRKAMSVALTMGRTSNAVCAESEGQKSGAQHAERLTTDTISTRLIHSFNDDWSMNAGVGWQQADRAMQCFHKILNNQGDISRSMKDSPLPDVFAS